MDGAAGTNYLDQIAPKTTRSSGGSFFSNKFMLIVGGLLVALILVIILSAALGSGAGKVKDSTLTLYLRATNVQANATNVHKDIRNSALRAANSELTTLLSNLTRDLNAYMLENNMGEEKQWKPTIVASEDEHNLTLTETLTNAKLNGVIDRLFPSEVMYELEYMMSLMNEIYNGTEDEALMEILEKSHNDLSALKERFAVLNGSSN